MSFQKIQIDDTDWTLIGDNVTSITFQNVGQFGVYINFNSSNTAPTEDVGVVYGPLQGELKRTCTELTYKATPSYVFARTISKAGAIVVETNPT